MDRDTYRGLRGLVVHVMPALAYYHNLGLYRRNACPSASISFGRVKALRQRDKAMGVKQRRCPWCLLPGDADRVAWHPACALYYSAARGLSASWVPSGKLDVYGRAIPLTEVVPDHTCTCGGIGAELDHRFALALAFRFGVRAWVRAMTPQNLQWLCGQCHKEKTRTDLNAMAYHDYAMRPRTPKDWRMPQFKMQGLLEV